MQNVFHDQIPIAADALRYVDKCEIVVVGVTQRDVISITLPYNTYAYVLESGKEPWCATALARRLRDACVPTVVVVAVFAKRLFGAIFFILPWLTLYVFMSLHFHIL